MIRTHPVLGEVRPSSVLCLRCRVVKTAAFWWALYDLVPFTSSLRSFCLQEM